MSFHMHITQKVKVDKSTGCIIFQTRTMSGCVYYFPLTFNQFMAFNDVITLIRNLNHHHHQSKGHYPLGQNLWFYYHSHSASFYDNGKVTRVYFRFHDFNLYLSHLHHKLLSFLRNEDIGRATGGTRRKHLIANKSSDYDDKGRVDEISNCKRPLSIIVRPKTEFETSKEHSEKWNSLSRSTNDAIMSSAGQTDTVLPKWNNTDSCRRYESKTATTHTRGDLPSPESVCISDIDHNHSFESMDSD